MESIPNVTVAVECAVHQAIKDVVLAAYRQHGIMVHKVEVEWLDCSTISTPRQEVMSVRLQTKMR